MGRISTSFALMKRSWGVLRAHPQLGLYPVVSALAMVLVTVAFLVPVGVALVAGLGSTTAGSSGSGGGGLPLAVYPALFVFYVAASFVQVFFNAALLAAADEHFRGGQPRFSDGLRAAGGRVGTIAAWALVAGTVGLVLRSVQERAGLLGRLVVGLTGVAWNLLTFFVVPVLVFEGLGPIAAVKRSGGLFRQRWGEAVVGSGGIGAATGLLSLPVVALVAAGVVLMAGGAVAAGAVVAATGAVAFVGLLVVSSAMQQIYNCALYRYATAGVGTGEFTAAELQGTFRPKRP